MGKILILTIIFIETQMGIAQTELNPYTVANDRLRVWHGQNYFNGIKQEKKAIVLEEWYQSIMSITLLVRRLKY